MKRCFVQRLRSNTSNHQWNGAKRFLVVFLLLPQLMHLLYTGSSGPQESTFTVCLSKEAVLMFGQLSVCGRQSLRQVHVETHPLVMFK